MKKILLLTLFLFSLLGITYAGNKSRLLYTDNLVSAAKEKVKKDSLMQKAWNDIKLVADEQLKRNSVDKLDYLSLAYIMTADKSYSDKIISVLKGVVNNKAWASAEMLSRKPAWRSDLGVAHKAYMTAIGYNTVYNDMADSRGSIQIGRGTFAWRLDYGAVAHSFPKFHGTQLVDIVCLHGRYSCFEYPE